MKVAKIVLALAAVYSSSSALAATDAAVATALGGGATVSATGALSAPSYTVGGATNSNVGDALKALDTKHNTDVAVLRNTSTQINVKTNTNGAATATALGGGATYVATTGQITAPKYTFGTQTHTNVGSALQALNSNIGAVEQQTNDLVRQVHGDLKTDINKLAGTNANEHKVLKAGIDTNSKAVDRIANDLYGMNNYSIVDGHLTHNPIKVGNTVAHSTTVADAFTNIGTTIDAQQASIKSVTSSVTSVNVKTNTNGTSTAAALGGGSTYVATTGQVTAPKYVVGGTTHNNVGSAITNLDKNIASVAADGRRLTMDLAEHTRREIQREVEDRIVEDKALGQRIDKTEGEINRVVHNILGVGNPKVGTNGENFQINSEIGSSNTVVGAVEKIGNELEEHEYRLDTIEAKTGLVKQGTTSNARMMRAAVDPTIYIGQTTGGKLVNISGTDGDRVLTGVEDGRIAADSTDAVNGSQLHSVMVNNQNNYKELRNRIDDNREVSSKGIASAMAMQIDMPEPNMGEFAGGVGIGTFDSETALALGTQYLSKSGNYKFGAAVSSGLSGDAKVGGRASFGFKF